MRLGEPENFNVMHFCKFFKVMTNIEQYHISESR